MTMPQSPAPSSQAMEDFSHHDDHQGSGGGAAFLYFASAILIVFFTWLAFRYFTKRCSRSDGISIEHWPKSRGPLNERRRIRDEEQGYGVEDQVVHTPRQNIQENTVEPKKTSEVPATTQKDKRYVKSDEPAAQAGREPIPIVLDAQGSESKTTRIMGFPDRREQTLVWGYHKTDPKDKTIPKTRSPLGLYQISASDITEWSNGIDHTEKVKIPRVFQSIKRRPLPITANRTRAFDPAISPDVPTALYLIQRKSVPPRADLVRESGYTVAQKVSNWLNPIEKIPLVNRPEEKQDSLEAHNQASYDSTASNYSFNSSPDIISVRKVNFFKVGQINGVLNTPVALDPTGSASKSPIRAKSRSRSQEPVISPRPSAAMHKLAPIRSSSKVPDEKWPDSPASEVSACSPRNGPRSPASEITAILVDEGPQSPVSEVNHYPEVLA